MSSEGPSPHLAVDSRSQTPPNQLTMLTARQNEVRGDGRADTWPSLPDAGPSSHYKQPEGLLPAFPSTQYSQLPTPQSPSASNRLIHAGPYPPESPLPPSSQSFNGATGSISQRFSQKSFPEEENSRTPSQMLTPDSSPFVSRSANTRAMNFATPTNYDTPTTSRINFETSILNTPPTLNLSSQGAPSPNEIPPPTSTLSSPFMAKAITSDRNNRISSRPSSAHPHDIFSPANPAGSQNSFQSAANFVLPGGELERLRQAEREREFTLAREAETRRPEYMKRAKHDPNAMEEDGERPVGIMESPVKGRRLKLFQETSEESFEESLMAGGYGRYRTADWVRQPQPISFPAGIAGASNIIQKLEAVEEVPEQPPTEKELKKRKRLEAFRSNRPESSLRSKLYPVELEGKGRVLLDIPNEVPPAPPSPEPSPSKRRATRRKKKSVEIPSKDKRAPLEQATALAGEDLAPKPNWPDSEFPWRLRTEERAEAAKAEEEERLKWIERFLDAESDEEDDHVPPSQSDSDSASRIETLPPPRMGRGKMVPLLAHPDDPRKAYQKKRTAFPTDPGDARAALLAKRSVRALSYRQMRRQREMNEDNEEPEELCICRGSDDGRELVQCDGCRTWYHLECIGIRDINELGREEDPWFCRRCMTRSRSPSSEPELLMSEPTFVPTDEAPHERSSDATLYYSTLQDSPNSWPSSSRIPKTPTRATTHTGGHAHSTGPWPDFSKQMPTTPKGQNRAVKVSAHQTPGQYEGFRVIHEETPFDPTSTPSRGIRFPGPFSTPKTTMWAARPGGAPLFHTPSRPTHNTRIGNRSFGGPGSLSAALDDMGSRPDASSHHHQQQLLGPPQRVEESPMRRNRSRDAASARRQLQPFSSMLEESPIMRNKGKERVVEGTTRL